MAVAKRKDDPIEDILNRIRSEIDRAHSSASSAECYLSDVELDRLPRYPAPKDKMVAWEKVEAWVIEHGWGSLVAARIKEDLIKD